LDHITSGRFWLDLQARYDLGVQRDRLSAKLERKSHKSLIYKTTLRSSTKRRSTSCRRTGVLCGMLSAE
jgi:hypothetical protein